MELSVRIIVDTPHDPAFNMAADLYLLDQCTKDDSTVYVRFYSWEPPSITIGYTQKPAKTLNLDTMAVDGVSWIRRSTGGRAVLHAEDITYSCIFPLSIAEMGTSITASYQIITRCLVRGFSEIGIECSLHDSFDELREVRREVKLPCFVTPNREEIMAGAKKLVGSAQKRTNDAVLQHGSIPLTDAHYRLPNYLNISEKEKITYRKLLRMKSTYISELRPEIPAETMVVGLAFGFERELPFTSFRQMWTREEREKITDLSQSDEFRSQWCTIDT
jgi:lipoyl(octanoyl) transferase